MSWNGKLVSFAPPRDREIRKRDLWKRVGRVRLLGKESRALERLRLVVLVVARAHENRSGQHHAIVLAEIRECRRVENIAIAFIHSREQMRFAIEPGIERFAALRCDRHDIVGVGCVLLLALRHDCPAAESGLPPQVCLPIAFVHGQRKRVRAFLVRRTSRRFLRPGVASIETVGAVRRTQSISIHPASVLQIGRGTRGACQPLPGIGVFGL
jgi:hypothetical protein